MWSRLILCVFLLAPTANAGEDHDHAAHKHKHHHEDKHQHDHAQDSTAAHVHGEALLQLAMEGRELVVMLVSPAANLVGFEQTAHTPEQKQQVNAAEARLREIKNWLVLKGGDCLLEKVNTDFNSVRAEAKVAEESSHADIHLDAHYLCAKPEELQGLTLALFRDFPEVKSVELEWALGNRQGAGELTVRSPGVAFGKP